MRLKLGLFFPKRKSYVEVSENRMLRGTLGPKKWKKTGDCTKVLIRIFVILAFSHNARVKVSDRLRGAFCEKGRDRY